MGSGEYSVRFRNKNHQSEPIKLMNGEYGVTSCERRKPDQFLSNGRDESEAAVVKWAEKELLDTLPFYYAKGSVSNVFDQIK